MKFNIDTLLLDIQFQGAPEIDQDQQIKKIESRLKGFIQNTFNTIQMPALPDWLTLLQEKIAVELEKAGQKKSITIDNLEFNLPVIDGQQFMQEAKGYFEQHILPVLTTTLNRSLQGAIQKACLLKLNGHGSEGSALADLSQYGVVEHTGLIFSHKYWYSILEALKTSEQYKNNFKRELLDPSMLAKIVSSIFNNTQEFPSLLTTLLPLLSPAINHRGFIPLLEHSELHLAQKKQQLKHYLRLILTAQDQQTELTELAIKIMLNSNKVASLDHIKELEPSNRQRFTHALAGLHQILLMPQANIWLSAADSWLNIVLHQGLKLADLVGLEKLLKRAKGNHWQALIQQPIVPAQLNEKYSLEGSYNLKQSIFVQKKLLELLTDLQNNEISLESVQYQIHKIKQYLDRHNSHLSADLVLLVKQNVLAGMDPENTEEDESILLGKGVNQLTVSISMFEDDLPSSTLNNLQQRIFNTLNSMADSAWIPISLSEKIQNFNVSHLNKLELKALLTEIIHWNELVNRLSNATKSLSRTVKITDKKQIEISKVLVTHLKDFIEAETNINLTAYDAIAWQYFIKICLIKNTMYLPLGLEKNLKDLIRVTNKSSAIKLKEALESSIQLEPIHSEHKSQKSISAEALYNKHLDQLQTDYESTFPIEWKIGQQINQVIKNLADMMKDSSALQSIPYPFINTDRANKQQLHRVLIQLITVLMAWQQQGRIDILDSYINKLLQINQLLQFNQPIQMPSELHQSDLHQSGKDWWLPMASMQLAEQSSSAKIGSTDRNGLNVSEINKLIWQSDLTQARQDIDKLTQNHLGIKQSQVLLKEYSDKINSLNDSKNIKKIRQKINQRIQSLKKQQADLQLGLGCNDAGLVLLWPYLAGFFKKNNLLTAVEDDAEGETEADKQEELQFKDQAAQLKAHALLVYILDAKQTEQVYTVANLLVGLEADTYIEDAVELSEQEQTNAKQLLSAVINNWPALKSMPINSFRELFLLRTAQYSCSEQGCIIEIESKTLDILLTKLPWGLGYISLPWQGKNLIQVKWAYGY